MLPSMLSSLHRATLKSNNADLDRLRAELESVDLAIRHAHNLDPQAAALKALGDLRKGYTGSGETVCKCCGRPF
jgi:hypothetical protein